MVGANMSKPQPFPPIASMDTIVPTSLADELAFRLEKEILDGKYRPGDRILQDALCARFGVSRTPVREALRKLQAQNLVELIPNRGATIRVPSRTEVEEVWAIRAKLEAFACELACARASETLLDELDRAQTLINSAQEILETREVAADEEAAFNAQITRGNEDFHGAIFSAAGNGTLETLCRSLQSHFPKDYVWRAFRSPEVARTLNVDEHRAIRDAIARADGAVASAAMAAHIHHARDLLIPYLIAHDLWK
jgi:DNA-binding GntR family transcriptional regulator